MYKCVTCSSTFYSVLEYNKHQLIHKNEPNLNIQCQYTGCLKYFQSYDNFKKHVYRMHNAGTFLSDNRYLCIKADCDFSCQSAFLFKKHFNLHLSEEGAQLTCPFPACPNSEYIFYNRNSFAIHLSTCHGNVGDEDEKMEIHFTNVHEQVDDDDNNDLRSRVDDEEDIQDYDSDEDEQSVLEDDTAEEESALNDIPFKVGEIEDADSTKMLAEMMLLLSAKHFATEPILQGTVQGIGSAFQRSLKQFQTTLRESNFSEAEKERLLNMFKISFAPFTYPLDLHTGSLRNKYARDKYYAENFNFIQPLEIELKKDGDEDVDKDKKHYYHYVPIMKSLQNVLADKNVREYFENTRPATNNNVFSDECDGTVIKDNQFLHKKSRMIYLIAFQDAFEIVNPLGSSKKKFKLVGLYMVPGNLPTFLRSKLRNLKLVLLCREKYVEIYGWDKVLKHMMTDLKLLESEGLTTCFQGRKIHYLGTLLVMLGDNLGSHQIGGFTENCSSSINFCRFCEISRDMLKAGLYGVQKLRNVDNHHLCCERAKKENQMVLGVKQKSVLNELLHYNVCNPGLPPCPAHDLFEGVVPYDLMFAIKYFVREAWFSYAYLNERLHNFRFCSTSQDMIPPMKEASKKVGGSASEIRRLLLVFPIVIHDKVQDFEDYVWQMVMHLREVCSLVCAPTISVEQVALLEQEIEDYLDLRIKCFPDIPLRPKHHYICHYSSLILHFGPLKHLWTIRFKSLHSYLKNAMRHCKNFKNVTKTLSRKHEQLQSVCMNEQQYDSKIIAESAIPFNSSKITDEETRSLISDLVNTGKVHLVCTEALFRGIMYKRDMTICVGKTDFDSYILCTIYEILINESRSNIYFLGLRHEVRYNRKFGVYEPSDMYFSSEPVSDTLSTFDYSELLSPDPLLKTNIGCTEVYASKYAPLDIDI